MVVALPRGSNRSLRPVGWAGDAAIARYLDPALRHLPDPSTMADMDVAVDRILRAIEKNETITVYGDYDVDGTCAAAVLVEFLRSIGAHVRLLHPRPPR